MSTYDTTYPAAFAAITPAMDGDRPAPRPLSRASDPAGVGPGEPEWIERARAGDTTAFERLYRTHSGRVYALCLRLLSDRGVAEEAVQDAFLRAWNRLGSFRGDSAFGSWLHRLAANVSIDRLRHEKRRGWDDEGLEALGESEDPDGVRASALPASATAVDLERAIRRLPPRARLVFVLHDVEGYRHGEIAALAGIAEGTSKAQLHRARKLLRQALTVGGAR